METPGNSGSEDIPEKGVLLQVSPWNSGKRLKKSLGFTEPHGLGPGWGTYLFAAGSQVLTGSDYFIEALCQVTEQVFQLRIVIGLIGVG